MFRKIFSKTSKEFKEFKKIIDVYNNLAKHASKQTDRNILSMTEIDLLNTSEILGIKIQEWKKSEKFSNELVIYIVNSFEETKTSGLPASSDFINQNYTYLKELLSKHESEEQLKIGNNPSDNILQEITNFKKDIKEFNKLFNVKRKIKMDPEWKQKIYLEKEGFKPTIKKGYFSEKKILKFIEKLKNRKTIIFDLIEKEGLTIEFYKEEVEKYFDKCFFGDNADIEYLDTLYGFISERNYYLTFDRSEKRYQSYCDLNSFVEDNGDDE